MTNKFKEKGSKFEREIVKALREVGFKARRGVAGASEDVGDITGIPSWCLEAKWRAGRHTFTAYVREAELEALNYEKKYWAVIANKYRHPISEAYVLISFKTWLKLIMVIRDQRREINRLRKRLLSD